MIFPIMPEIGGGGASTEVDLFAEDRITDVRKVADVGVRQNEAILDFDGLADVASIADGGIATDITIRADLAIFADDDVAFDEDTGKDAGAFAKVKDAFDHGEWMDFTMDQTLTEGGDEDFIGSQKIPWVTNDKGSGGGAGVREIRGATDPGKWRERGIDKRAIEIGKIRGIQPCVRMEGKFRRAARAVLVCMQRNVSDRIVFDSPGEGKRMTVWRIVVHEDILTNFLFYDGLEAGNPLGDLFALAMLHENADFILGA